MKVVFLNNSKDTLISIVIKGSNRILELRPGESSEVSLESERDIRDYLNSYACFGLDISIKKEPEPVIEPVVEAPVEEAPKKSSRRSKKSEPATEVIEEAPIVEAPVVEAPVEEGSKEESAE